MRTDVLIIFNEVGKIDKGRGLLSILSFFATSKINSIMHHFFLMIWGNVLKSDVGREFCSFFATG